MTFTLRVATPRLSETTQATLENIHRCYSALFVYDDPRVELLMADNREVLPFNHRQPLSMAGHEATRMDLLVLGHLRAVDSPLEIGDDGYLAMAEFYRHMARWESGVDSLVSSDTPRQQKQFISGLRRATRKIGLLTEHACGFDNLFAHLDALGGDVYRHFYGPERLDAWKPEGHFEACRRVGHVGIDDLIVDRSEGTNWPLFNEFLRVQTEGLCHRRLKTNTSARCCRPICTACRPATCTDASYETGYGDYAQRAIMIMHRKQLPEHICEQARALFGSPSSIPERRAYAALEAQKILGLSETQLGVHAVRALRGAGHGPGAFPALLPPRHAGGDAGPAQGHAGRDRRRSGSAVDGRCQRLAHRHPWQAVPGECFHCRNKRKAPRAPIRSRPMTALTLQKADRLPMGCTNARQGIEERGLTDSSTSSPVLVPGVATELTATRCPGLSR